MGAKVRISLSPSTGEDIGEIDTLTVGEAISPIRILSSVGRKVIGKKTVGSKVSVGTKVSVGATVVVGETVELVELDLIGLGVGGNRVFCSESSRRFGWG